MNLEEKVIKTRFSSNLKQVMAIESVSELKLSDGTGISQSALNRIKNGQVCPSLFQAILIANFFNISMEDLLKDPVSGQTIEDPCVPIVHSSDFLNENEKHIQGFYRLTKGASSEGKLGFKFDNSFSCSILNPETVVIVNLVSDTSKLKNGSTVLFVHDMKFKIGNYFSKKLRPIDMLTNIIDPADVVIIGNVSNMETEYIRDVSIVEKLVKSIGKAKIDSVFDKALAFSS